MISTVGLAFLFHQLGKISFLPNVKVLVVTKCTKLQNRRRVGPRHWVRDRGMTASIEPDKLTVPKLKAELKKRGLEQDGLKAVLLARLKEAIGGVEESLGGDDAPDRFLQDALEINAGAIVRNVTFVGHWRPAMDAFAARVKNGEVEPGTVGPTFQGLNLGTREAVHAAARELGLASKSEGSDDDGTRTVRVFARKRPAWTHASAGISTGDAPASISNHDTASDDISEESPHGPSAFETSLPDLRSTPFDMYKALRIPRSDEKTGGYSGGTARARASYHKEAVRTYPTSDRYPGRGACDGCGGALTLGRWMHRPAPLRSDAPDDDPEFGLMDDEEDNEGDAIIASSIGDQKREVNTAFQNFTRRRRDLCPTCFHRETRERPGGKRFGDDTSDAKKDFTDIQTFKDLGRERPRYDITAYAAFRERRTAAADKAAKANARALAAVAGPEAMALAAEMDAMETKKETEKKTVEQNDDILSDQTPNSSETTRFAAEVSKFQKVTIAYLVLRDAERQRVLDEGGYKALVKHESHLENDVFDCDPWDVYERFFKGEEEEDRQYLLLHGGGEDSDEEEEGDESDEESDDDAMVEEALVSAKHERFEKAEEADRKAENLEAPPAPPVSVLMAMHDVVGVNGTVVDGEGDDLPGMGGKDVWRVMAERCGEDAVGDGVEDEDETDDEDDEDEPNPWTDQTSAHVVYMGCPSEDDEPYFSVSDPSDEESDGPPEEIPVKRKRQDDEDDQVDSG